MKYFIGKKIRNNIVGSALKSKRRHNPWITGCWTSECNSRKQNLETGHLCGAVGSDGWWRCMIQLQSSAFMT